MAKNNNIYDMPRVPNEKIKKGIIIGVIVFFIVITVFQSFYTVKEQEQAVLLTFGNAATVSESGLHFKIPYIQRVKKVDTTIQGFAMGYNQQTNASIENESLMITSDYNFINVDFFIEYQVSDPIKALYNSVNPVEILKNISQGCIRTVIGSTTVDEVLTTGKSEIQSKIKTMISSKLEEQDLGIYLVNITMQDAEPPTSQVIAAFKAVETAKQGKETALNNANKYKNEQIPAASANVDKIIRSAEAQKEKRINEAKGQVARFNAMYEQYIKFPEVTKQRMFYETLEEVLPGLTVVIDSGDGNIQKLLPLESFSKSVIENNNETKGE